MKRICFGLALLALSGVLLALAQPVPTSTGQFRTAPITGTGSSDYAITIGNRYSQSTVSGWSRTVIELTNGDPSNRLVRVDLSFCANSAAATVPFRIWLGKKGLGATPDFEYQLLGTGSFTTRASGAGVAASSIITSSEYVADTVSFVPATAATSPIGIYDLLNASYGTTYTVFSPGSLVPAHLLISDLGNYRFLIFDADPGNGVNPSAIIDPGT
jgi:hypothetical protein